MEQDLVIGLKDDGGRSQNEISLEDDGSLLIDLSRGIRDSFDGSTIEVKCFRTIRAPALAKLMSTIGADRDTLLADLQYRFPATSQLEAFLTEHGIESDSRSRAGH